MNARKLRSDSEENDLLPKTDSVQRSVKKSHAHKLIFGYLALLIIAALMGSIYQWQHHKVTVLNSKVASLQSRLAKTNNQNAKNQKSLSAADNQLEQLQNMNKSSTFTYDTSDSETGPGGLSLTLPKTYEVLDAGHGGAPGDLFKVVPSSESHVISDFSFWDEATVDATETFTNLSQATTEAKQQTMDSDNCGPQNGGCDISDFTTSNTTIGGLPAELIKANGVNEDLGWVNVYVTGLGKWEYTITFNNVVPNEADVNNLVSTILNGITIKPAGP